jgi:hypothetical protein
VLKSKRETRPNKLETYILIEWKIEKNLAGGREGEREREREREKS